MWGALQLLILYYYVKEILHYNDHITRLPSWNNNLVTIIGDDITGSDHQALLGHLVKPMCEQAVIRIHAGPSVGKGMHWPDIPLGSRRKLKKLKCFWQLGRMKDEVWTQKALSELHCLPWEIQCVGRQVRKFQGGYSKVLSSWIMWPCAVPNLP